METCSLYLVGGGSCGSWGLVEREDSRAVEWLMGGRGKEPQVRRELGPLCLETCGEQEGLEH